MRIAIVEDEQDLALELHALLQKLGSRQHCAVSRRRAVSIRMGGAAL